MFDMILFSDSAVQHMMYGFGDDPNVRTLFIFYQFELVHLVSYSQFFFRFNNSFYLVSHVLVIWANLAVFFFFLVVLCVV